MKSAGVAAGCVLLVFLALVGLAAGMPRPAGEACPPAGAGSVVPAGAVPAGPVAGYRGEQLVNAAHILAAGAALGLSGRDQTIGVMVAMGESTLRVLDYGDAAGPDSRGLFQQQANGAWGSYEDRMNPRISATNFFTAMVRAVPDRDGLAPTVIGHRTQRNKDPDHYTPFWQKATTVVAALTGNPAATSAQPGAAQVACTPSSPASPGGGGQGAQQAIAFALAQRGKPYVWGAEGPDAFDCSGLTLRAWQAAGVRLDRTSRQQFHNGLRIPIGDAQPGDLLFWADNLADRSTIHHVALYLGGGQIVEAQQKGVPVHTRAVKPGESQLLGVVVRPGTRR